MKIVVISLTGKIEWDILIFLKILVISSTGKIERTFKPFEK